jgi:uncharacterized protein YgiM (DUF1202 family)
MKLYPDISNISPDAPELIGLTLSSNALYFQLNDSNGSTGLNFSSNYWTSTRKYYQGVYSYVTRHTSNEYSKYFLEDRGGYTKLSIRCISDMTTAEIKRNYEGFKLLKNKVLYEVFDTYKDTKDPYLNIRNGPGSTYAIVYKLVDGDIIEILEANVGPSNSWCKIYYPANNITGYVHNKYIKKID